MKCKKRIYSPIFNKDFGNSPPWCWILPHQKLIPSCLLLSPPPSWRQENCTTAPAIAVVKMNQRPQLQYVYPAAESVKQLNMRIVNRKHAYQTINNSFKRTSNNVQTTRSISALNHAMNKLIITQYHTITIMMITFLEVSWGFSNNCSVSLNNYVRPQRRDMS